MHDTKYRKYVETYNNQRTEKVHASPHQGKNIACVSLPAPDAAYACLRTDRGSSPCGRDNGLYLQPRPGMLMPHLVHSRVARRIVCRASRTACCLSCMPPAAPPIARLATQPAALPAAPQVARRRYCQTPTAPPNVLRIASPTALLAAPPVATPAAVSCAPTEALPIPRRLSCQQTLQGYTAC